jgi:MFS family permease
VIIRNFGILRQRPYLLVWLSQTLSDLAEWMVFVALSLLLFDMTGSGLSVAILRICHAVPMLLLGPPGGVLVDRWDQRWVMSVSAGLRALLVLALVPLSSPWAIYALVLGINVLLVVFDPARASLLPGLVSEAQLPTANSVISTTKMLTIIFGAALAGVLVQAAGPGQALLVAFALLWVAALAPLAVVRVGLLHPRMELALDLSTGLRFALSQPLVWGTILLEGLLISFLGTYQILGVVYAERYLRDPGAYSQLLMALGVGSLAGMLLSAPLARRMGYVRPMVAGMVVATCAMVWLSARMDPWWGSAGYLAIGTASLLVDVSVTTLLQRIVPNGMRGRIFGVRHTLVHVGVLAGNGLAGLLADILELRWLFLGAGALGILVTGAAVALLLRKNNGVGEVAATFPTPPDS